MAHRSGFAGYTSPSAIPGDIVTEDAPGETPRPGKIDTTVPHSARIWNYWLGGKDHYPVDREAGDAFREIYPDIVDVARAVRYFLARAVRYLAGEAGIRQFLDIGTGLPTADNTHEIAQRVAPESRIVYVDNDPLVLVHARALLTSRPEGACAYVDADVRDPAKVLDAAAGTLDFSQPVALMMLGILGHVGDDGQARSIVRQLTAALAPGSYLTLSDGANTSKAREQAHQRYAQTGAVPYRLRSPEQIAAFFDGMDLLEPGVVPVSQWRPDPSPFGPPRHVDTFGGMARKR
jgi:O-methyltransferase involved in polyketide biosynthesis